MVGRVFGCEVVSSDSITSLHEHLNEMRQTSGVSKETRQSLDYVVEPGPGCPATLSGHELAPDRGGRRS